jgi:hypothetical protein
VTTRDGMWMELKGGLSVGSCKTVRRSFVKLWTITERSEDHASCKASSSSPLDPLTYYPLAKFAHSPIQ